MFAKNVIALDSALTTLPLKDRGYDSTGKGTSHSHVLSPDGKTVAYVDDAYGEKRRGQFDNLYLLDLATGRSRWSTHYKTQFNRYLNVGTRWTSDRISAGGNHLSPESR